MMIHSHLPLKCIFHILLSGFHNATNATIAYFTFCCLAFTMQHNFVQRAYQQHGEAIHPKMVFFDLMISFLVLWASSSLATPHVPHAFLTFKVLEVNVRNSFWDVYCLGSTLISDGVFCAQQLVSFLVLRASSTLAAPHVPDALLLTILTRGPHFHTHNAPIPTVLPFIHNTPNTLQ